MVIVVIRWLLLWWRDVLFLVVLRLWVMIMVGVYFV